MCCPTVIQLFICSIFCCHCTVTVMVSADNLPSKPRRQQQQLSCHSAVQCSASQTLKVVKLTLMSLDCLDDMHTDKPLKGIFMQDRIP